jgi:hypothetical protein
MWLTLGKEEGATDIFLSLAIPAYYWVRLPSRRFFFQPLAVSLSSDTLLKGPSSAVTIMLLHASGPLV